MPIKLNAATGGGSVSLSAPNSTTSNADVTLTLPPNDGDASQYLQTDGAGALSWQTVASLSNAEDGTGTDFEFNSGYGSNATAYGCRAWVNFDGTGTVTIRGSGNVSSITDHTTGQYSVSYTNNMPDANYAYTFGARDQNNGMGVPTLQADPDDTPATYYIRIIYNYPANQNYYDPEDACVAIFR